MKRWVWKRINLLCREWAFEKIWKSEEKSIPFFVDAAILFFHLHRLQCQRRYQLLLEAQTKAPYIVIVDYRQPERNLDYIAFSLSEIGEYFGPHAQQHRCFMQKGGIEGILCASSFVPLYREPCLGGAATILLCKNPNFGTENMPIL